MAYKRILVVSDNEDVLKFLIKILADDPNLSQDRCFSFVCSPTNHQMAGHQIGAFRIQPLGLKTDTDKVIADYDLIISAHCKQMFPEKLVTRRKCINIHPGFNPYNRGWYPQVFSIINGLPLGATIHEIDGQVDHGPIIAQKRVPIYGWDTSADAYKRVQAAERELVEQNLSSILDGDYKTKPPKQQGNLNLKKDFEKLREIKMDEVTTFRQAIDRLRALTHDDYKNAYFLDPVSGRKIFIRISLEPEEQP